MTDNEEVELLRPVKFCDWSNAGLLRAVGLNHSVRAQADIKAVRELVKLNSDLGRMAGLLSFWLAEGLGAKPIQVERMIIGFRKLQGAIQE